MTSDRRTRRAHAPLLALEYFLDAERERSGASALGVFLDSEPLVVSAEESASGLLLTELLADGSTCQRDLYVHALPFGESSMKLASLDRRVGSARSVAATVERILGENIG
ncbi:MAG: hypothetical protein IPM79_24625 [Polyangiaceae bacterium]|jgi:hypothetical protein|nr:hypothetical protein [Polyangiaceae bacterium]MBK8940714.1 hypothetical protein [Polyangiaceae bacterium]